MCSCMACRNVERMLAQAFDIDSDVELVFVTAAKDDTFQGSDIGIIPSPRYGDMLLGRNLRVGRIEIDPTTMWHIDTEPGM